MEVLVSGLNTYLGRRAASRLANEKMQVTGLVRNINLFKQRTFEPLSARLIQVDLLKKTDALQAFSMEGLELAFYFTQVPDLSDRLNLKLELMALKNYIELVRRNKCIRIVYVARLMDVQSVDMIRSLFEQFRIKYTIVLKNTIVGRQSLLDKIFKVLSTQKVKLYLESIAKIKFKPMTSLDFIRWLQEMPWENQFIGQVLTVGGEREMSFMDLFNIYSVQHPKGTSQVKLPLPKFIYKMIYTKIYGLHAEDFDEYRRIIRYEYPADNSAWQKVQAFQFSPLEEALAADY